MESLVDVVARDDEDQLTPDFFEVCEVEFALRDQRSRQPRGADRTAL